MYPQRSVMTCGLATALEPPHFNHAPVRGAIGASFSRRSRAGSFNPRTRVGCDQCVCVSCLQLHCVSIHAPAWGATPSSCPLGLRSGRFNPRTRVGCDALPRCSRESGPSFQSTHPRGVRLRVAGGSGAGGLVSIHAPAWGATRGACRRVALYKKFQSTHPRGVRLGYASGAACGGSVSIHAPAWGATRTPKKHRRGLLVSIHAPAWGATEKELARRYEITSFNPRTRVGCDKWGHPQTWQ